MPQLLCSSIGALAHCLVVKLGSGSSNVVLIKTEQEFNSSLKDVQDKSLPAVYYFTAVWCGPYLLQVSLYLLSQQNLA
ncbi:unnamed protein product, partial [Linum tenue]